MYKPGVYFSTSTGFIARWDPNVGVETVVSSNVFVTDIAFDQQGQLYAISFTSLYLVDPKTGALQLKGPLSGSLFAGHRGTDQANGFDIGPDGTALVTSANNSVIASVDLQTGALTNVGLLPQGVFSAGDIYIDDSSGFIRVAVSTSNFNIANFGKVLVNGQPTDRFGFINSDFIGSKEIFGLTGPVDGTIGPIGFDKTKAYDLGAPGGVFGNEIGSFTIPGGYITGAATLKLTDSSITVVIPEAGPAGSVYRFFNERTGVHFYTSSVDERDNIITSFNWFQYEGGGFVAAGDVAVYRFFNTETGAHFYTASESEKDAVTENLAMFNYEGIGYYINSQNDGDDLALHRFFNTETSTHFYTASDSERDSILNSLPNFNYEGVIGYVDVA